MRFADALMRFPAVGILLVTGLAAQTPIPPQDQPSGGELIRRGSEAPEPRMETLNVVVLDNHGQSVTDLTADDFQVTDGGKPLAISYFHVNNAKTYARREAATKPQEFSNGFGVRAPGATVILLDFLNLGFGARGMAVNNIEHQLPQMESANSLYLYIVSVDGMLLPVRGVPRSNPGLPNAPPSEQPEPASRPWTQRIKPLLDSAVQAVTRIRNIDIDVFVRTRLTFQVLDSLGAQLEAIPGRKNVIWVTDGVPIELGYRRSDTGMPIDFTPEMRTLSDALDRSYVALYPVRQIMLGRSDNIGEMSGGAGATYDHGTGLESIATLDLLADLTGGRRTTDKDVGAAVQQSTRDLAFSYQIGFYASPENWDDNFHKLRITTKRKGAHVQAKSGYYAWKYAAGNRSWDAFMATAAAPNDAEEIGIRATVEADQASRSALRVNILIDGQDVWMVREGDHYAGHLRVMAVGYASDGKSSSAAPQSFDVRLSAAEREHAIRDGISFTLLLPEAQNLSRFKVMVFDRSSNGVGSITIPMTASGLPSNIHK